MDNYPRDASPCGVTLGARQEDWPSPQAGANKAAEKTPGQEKLITNRAGQGAARKRTQTINGLRGHLAEFGIIAPQGPAHIGRLAAQVDASEGSLPEPVRVFCRMLLDGIKALADRIAELNTEVKRRARQDETARRLMTIPGVGPVRAIALEALAPPVDIFKTGRDFAAWMGLTPRQHSTGGKPRLGKTSKMGQRDLRRLLIIGASAVVRWAARRGAAAGSWLANMLARKPRMLVVVALAISERMNATGPSEGANARIAWALMAHGGTYRASAGAAQAA